MTGRLSWVTERTSLKLELNAIQSRAPIMSASHATDCTNGFYC